MTGPKPYAADNPFAPGGKYSADNPFAGAPDFSDVEGGRSVKAPPERPNPLDAAMEQLPGVGPGLAALNLVAGVKPSDVGREMIQGATGNYADEAGVTDPDKVKKFEGDHPLYAMGANASGAALGLPGRLASGGGLLRLLLGGAAGGAIAGSGIDEENRGRGAMVGGALGLAPGILAGAAKVPITGQAARILGRLVGIKTGGTGALKILQALGGEAEPQFPSGLGKVLPASETDAALAGIAGKAPRQSALHIPEIQDSPTHLSEPTPTPSRVSDDAVQAVRDFHAGKISGEDLRTALDVAAGRTPAEPLPPRPPDAPPATELPGVVSRETVAPPVEAPPPTIRPSPTMPRFKLGETRFGAKVVEPGPYQKAAPNTRMDSRAMMPPSRLAQSLADDPEALAAQLELLRSLGQTEPNQRMVEEIARAMAERSVKP